MQLLKSLVCLIQEVIASIRKLGNTEPQPKLGLMEFLRLLSLKPWKVVCTCMVVEIALLADLLLCRAGFVAFRSGRWVAVSNNKNLSEYSNTSISASPGCNCSAPWGGYNSAPSAACCEWCFERRALTWCTSLSLDTLVASAWVFNLSNSCMNRCVWCVCTCLGCLVMCDLPPALS